MMHRQCYEIIIFKDLYITFGMMGIKISDTDRVILGIDPGTSVMGFGVLSIKAGNIALLGSGVIRLEKIPEHSLKLNRIFEECRSLISKYHPDEMAIEAPFYGKNVQSMLKLGRAQGVAIAAAISFEIPVFEYSPKAIKQSITGNGNASKEQVAAMLKNQALIDEIPKFLDATDGLAAALCHYQKSGHNNNPVGKKRSSWDSFIKNNPERTIR
jgi:crossover junction endodeoxyribonuclease RuvC